MATEAGKATIDDTRVNTRLALGSRLSERERERERGDKEARSGIRNPTWPRGWPRSFRYRQKQTETRERHARGVVRDDLVEAADRNTLARPILTHATFARSTDHHLRRWPSYFRRARQCHVAKQDRIPASVYPWTTESSSNFNSL